MYREESATFLPRLEANFCKDFSCCGLILDDLHHLLQHYEDHHVRLEDDMSYTNVADIETSTHASHGNSTRPDINQLKRKAMLDMQFHLQQHELTSRASMEPEETAFDLHSHYGDNTYFRRRNFQSNPMSPTVLTSDLFTPAHSPSTTPDSSLPATPLMSQSHDFTPDMDNTLLFGPPTSSDDWLSRDAGYAMPQLKKSRAFYQSSATSDMIAPKVVEHPGSNLVVVDKPYKCPVMGCDKAYKNQNGLKYHKMHGNCATSPLAFSSTNGHPVPHMVQENKPYSCTLCSKRYKNLNGLKYHTAHSHQHVTTDSVLRVIQDSHQFTSAY